MKKAILLLAVTSLFACGGVTPLVDALDQETDAGTITADVDSGVPAGDAGDPVGADAGDPAYPWADCTRHQKSQGRGKGLLKSCF